MSNLFEKQQKPFAIKLSERVKEEIKKEFGSDYHNQFLDKLFFHYPSNDINFKYKNGGHHYGFIKENHTLITEAEFFGDGNNKLREKLMPYASGYIGSSMLTNTEYPEQIDKNTDELEQINDDFADKFFDWANVNAYKYPTTTTTAELRQIFKTQYYE